MPTVPHVCRRITPGGPITPRTSPVIGCRRTLQSAATALGAVALLAASLGSAYANLLSAVRFETQVVGGTDQAFSVGSSLGAWTVVGPNGASVAVLTNTYEEPPAFFTSQDSNQNVDLSSPGNQGFVGVAQTVSTIHSAVDALSFYVGTQDTEFASYAIPGSDALVINGTQVGTYTNNNVTTDNVNWQQFSHQFTATRIAFDSALPAGASANHTIFDTVYMEETSGPVAAPEPASLALLGVGLLGVGVVRRRWRRH